jgi:hypothetical protein
MRALALALALVAGCKQSDGREEALKLANDLGTDALAKINAAMAAGKPTDAIFDCAAVLGDELRKGGGAYVELADKLEKLCDHDVPLAVIEKSVQTVEAARAKAPDDKMLTACMVDGQMDIGLALKSLKNRDDAKALLARFAVACPDEKLE